eukprot:353504-Chlamydomonas_euryale.AAC.10
MAPPLSHPTTDHLRLARGRPQRGHSAPRCAESQKEWKGVNGADGSGRAGQGCLCCPPPRTLVVCRPLAAMAQHPLEHRWTLWFDNPITRPIRNNYVQSVKSVYSFDTVEDFWW